MIEVIFFDIDDTLVDHSGAERKAVRYMGQSKFPDITGHLFETTWLEMTRKHWELFRKGEKTFAQQRVDRIQDIWHRFGRIIDTGEADRHFEEYLDRYERNWALFSDVSETISNLKSQNVPLGIISNGNYDQQIRKLQVTGIISYFQEDLILISERLGISKPDPRIFITAQEMSERRNILIVGDDLTLDIEPAIALGWKGALIDRFSRYSSPANSNYQRLTNLKDIFRNEFREK